MRRIKNSRKTHLVILLPRLFFSVFLDSELSEEPLPLEEPLPSEEAEGVCDEEVDGSSFDGSSFIGVVSCCLASVLSFGVGVS